MTAIFAALVALALLIALSLLALVAAVRWAADVLCVLIVLIGHALALPLFAWRGSREGASPRVERAALLWDLLLATLLGAEPGETVSTWAQRVRSQRWACLLCRLLDVRWPGHCDDADGVLFNLVRRRRTPES